MKYLALYFRAPMQSWGVSGRFGERPTMSFPSKSGVIGMLAAAAGVDRTEDAWTQRASMLSFSVRAYRCGPRLSDYHTVGGGYDSKSSYEKRCIPAKAEDGKPGNTTLTRREYLQDAVFGVVMGGEDEELLVRMAEQIQNPVWGVWLGRKACIPTEPIFAGVEDSESAAWNVLERRAEKSKKSCAGETRACQECQSAEADDILLDVPVSFSRRIFGSRSVAYSTSEWKV